MPALKVDSFDDKQPLYLFILYNTKRKYYRYMIVKNLSGHYFKSKSWEIKLKLVSKRRFSDLIYEVMGLMLGEPDNLILIPNCRKYINPTHIRSILSTVYFYEVEDNMNKTDMCF